MGDDDQSGEIGGGDNDDDDAYVQPLDSTESEECEASEANNVDGEKDDEEYMGRMRMRIRSSLKRVKRWGASMQGTGKGRGRRGLAGPC